MADSKTTGPDLTWLKENIDYRENGPGVVFYPWVFSDDRGSIKIDGLEWKAGDEMMHFTRPMEIWEIEDLCRHAWSVNCALTDGPMWKRRSEQLARIRENGKSEPVLLEVGGEMRVSPTPGDELRPFSSLTLDEAHAVTKHLSDTLIEVYGERRMLWSEVKHWRDDADHVRDELNYYRYRSSREAIGDLVYAVKMDCRRAWWNLKGRFRRPSSRVVRAGRPGDGVLMSEAPARDPIVMPHFRDGRSRKTRIFCQ